MFISLALAYERFGALIEVAKLAESAVYISLDDLLIFFYRSDNETTETKRRRGRVHRLDNSAFISKRK